jgi:hypothetical protein
MIACKMSDVRGNLLHSYCIAGLTVRSEIALPGLIAARRGDDPPEVAIQRGPVPTSLDGAGASGPTWQIAGGRFLLRIPDIARFLLTRGSEIVFEAENDAPPEEVAICLLGTVFGILLHQREQIVLHASAVRVNGKAVLFCGPSGAGKSTVAAALAQRGYPLVTDDFCTLTAAGSGAPLVHPDGRKLKLWAQAIERLDLDRRRGDRVRRSLGKFYVEPGEASTEPLALGACLCSARSATTAQSGDRAAQCRRRSAAAARQRLPAVAGAAHGAEGELFSRRDDRQWSGDFPSDAGVRLRRNAACDRLAGSPLAGAGPGGAGGVTRTIWLASYPKFGTTWFRMRRRRFPPRARFCRPARERRGHPTRGEACRFCRIAAAGRGQGLQRDAAPAGRPILPPRRGRRLARRTQRRAGGADRGRARGNDAAAGL